MGMGINELERGRGNLGSEHLARGPCGEKKTAPAGDGQRVWLPTSRRVFGRTSNSNRTV